MTIQDIAAKHERTVEAILFRLCQEGFIDSWIDARGYQEYSKNFDCLVGGLDSAVNAYDYGEDVDDDVNDDVNDDSDYKDEDEDDDDDEDDEDYENYENDNISSLNQRVWSLETAVSDIKDIIGTLLSKFSTSNPVKTSRKPQLSVEI
jgi:TATA-binding protein-associated factor Taf7